MILQSAYGDYYEGKYCINATKKYLYEITPQFHQRNCISYDKIISKLSLCQHLCDHIVYRSSSPTNPEKLGQILAAVIL
jgi:hypothetical protein